MSENETVKDDIVVAMHYTLRGDNKEILDASEEQSPLFYLHGYGQIIPGLEKALVGKKKGDKVNVTVTPEEGYGPYQKELVLSATKDQFPPNSPIEVGALFELQGSNSEVIAARISAVNGDAITLDANHPLAGQTLHFEVTIHSVRAATKEELQHGHAHGPDGHHHHE